MFDLRAYVFRSARHSVSICGTTPRDARWADRPGVTDAELVCLAVAEVDRGATSHRDPAQRLMLKVSAFRTASLHALP
jgi:hypothetical protein